MSEQELYDIARERIDRRNRRWVLWAIHLAAFIAYVGVFIMLASTAAVMLALFGLIAWSGVFTLHCIVVGLAESRDGSIENEVVKLRKALGDAYEKPKRLELGEDGELTEVQEREPEYAKRSRNS